MSEILLFPWWCPHRIQDPTDPIQVGDWQLHPFRRESRAAFPPAVVEKADLLLQSYATPRGASPTKCVLARLSDRDWLEPFVEDAAWQELQVSVCFAGLAGRKFFSNGLAYCTSLEFEAVPWTNLDAAGGLVYSWRRKDGGGSGYAPRGDLHRFRLHAEYYGDYFVDVEWDLARAMYSAFVDDEPRLDLFDAAVHFNLANADSRNLPSNIELLLLRGCLERLAGRTPRDEARAGFGQPLDRLRGELPGEAVALAEHRRRINPPERMSAFEAWAWDLHRTRGALAHGHTEPSDRRNWSVPEHVLLSCYLTPLLVRNALIDSGHLSADRARPHMLRAFDELLNLRSHDEMHDEYTHSWAHIVGEAAQHDLLVPALRQAMRRLESNRDSDSAVAGD